MSKPKTTISGNAPDDEHWDSSAPTGQKLPDGQHKDHWVLPESERAKGYVRPVRTAYVHKGPTQPGELRDLTADELERYKDVGYVKFEAYPDPEGSVSGRFWTQAQLDALKVDCGAMTRMPQAVAETYARDPSYYSQTFCVGCKDYLPVGEFVWDGTDERLGT